MLGTVHRAGLPGGCHNARRAGADDALGDVDADTRGLPQDGLLCRRVVLGRVHYHALRVGQEHAAIGAGEGAFHAVQVELRGRQQLAVAAEGGVQATRRDGIEHHRAPRVCMGAIAAHPRLDHRLADQT